ncbi:hypothetical protein Vafri_15758 [Volvox africanus]|nr:hypothetical protein Vafri_15758 [Volvox africanus]
MNVAHGYPTRSQRKKPGNQGATAGGSLETSFTAASRATLKPTEQGTHCGTFEEYIQPREENPGKSSTPPGPRGTCGKPDLSPTRDVCTDGQGPALTAAPLKGSSGQDQDGTLTRAPDQLAPAPGREAGRQARGWGAYATFCSCATSGRSSCSGRSPLAAFLSFWWMR